MARPDFAFRTSQFTAFAESQPGVYRLEPGAQRIFLSIDRQAVPEEVLSPELERAALAWVLARGGRRLCLNSQERKIKPSDLDRPTRREVKRLVSIAPSNAEIVGALGATGLLVGCESSSDYPPEVLTLPRLGPDLAVDMDALAALKPGLVLASLTVPGMERNITALERLGLPYIVLAPQSVADILSDIQRVGDAIGFAARAQQLVESIQSRLTELRAEPAARHPARVYLEWWPKPMFTPAQACWSNELIRLAGGVNVFERLAGQSAEISTEQVAEADPDVIFVAWCGVPFKKLNVERVLKREGLERVRAVRERRVYPIDENLLGRPGPRVIEGIAAMARALRGA